VRKAISGSPSLAGVTKISLDHALSYAAQIGLKGVDLLGNRRVGNSAPLRTDLHHGYAAEARSDALNRVENHTRSKLRFGRISPLRPSWRTECDYLLGKIAAACR